MFVKLFTSIYQGTLRGDANGLLVFINLLAHCGSDGEVDVHPRAIAEETGLSQDAVRKTLLRLEAPDEESRSPELDGRRIVRLDEHRAWGWKIVNYGRYRDIRNAETRREQNRMHQALHRARNRVEEPTTPYEVKVPRKRLSASVSKHKHASAK